MDNNLLFSKSRSVVGVSCGIKNIIDVNVMTGRGCCYAGLRCLCQTRHVHWSFHLLCNCRVGMTYVRIVPSFITHSQLLATTTSWCGRQPVERISSQSLQNKYLTFSDCLPSQPPGVSSLPVTRSQLPHVYSPLHSPGGSVRRSNQHQYEVSVKLKQISI